MKALINKRTIIIASVSLLIALITLISVNVFNSAGPVTGFANTITRPVRSLASTVARAFENIYSAIYRFEELERRHDELLQRVGQLQLDHSRSEEIAEENDRLRSLLEFRRRHGHYAHEPATLRNWTGDNWTHTFTINAGYTNSNIREGMGIASESGILYGQVFSVGATESTVITVLDTRFKAAVFIGGETTESIEDSDGTASVRGDFNHMHSGLLIIDFIDDNVVVNRGSFVVTSGAGGVFPSGLTVGEIVQVYDHASGIGRYATVRPSSPIESITEVYIILGFDHDNVDGPVDEPIDEPAEEPFEDWDEDQLEDRIIE